MAIRIPVVEATPIHDEVKAEFDFYAERCEHGLSKWLCDGPNHYPPDPYEDFPF